MTTTELEAGIELDRLVAQACGIDATVSYRFSEPCVIRKDEIDDVCEFAPSDNPTDTLYAMDCLRKNIQAEFNIQSFDDGKWIAELTCDDGPYGEADTFPLAVCRAIAQVKP